LHSLAPSLWSSCHLTTEIDRQGTLVAERSGTRRSHGENVTDLRRAPSPAACPARAGPWRPGFPVRGPALQLIYDTAPIGLAFLSPDCRYLQINQRLREICGISVEDHLGRSVRDCVPALADAVQGIVDSIMNTGAPVIGVEVAGQRADQTDERSWVTYWHPLRNSAGEIVGVNVAAEEITERKRAEAALRASERQFHTLADSIPQLVWMAEAGGKIFWFNNHWHEYTGTDSHDWQAVLAPGPFHKARDRWAQALLSIGVQI
jgi:PAS domain S-box-containing protein